MGRLQPADQRGALRPAARSASSTTWPSARCSSRSASSAPHPDYRRSLRAYTETAWASIFCDNLFLRPAADDLNGFRPNFTIIDAPSFLADPERDGHAQRDRHPRPSQPRGDHHRRHPVRRRDEEGRLPDHELPLARRGRAADALVGQRGRGRRRRRSSSASRAPARPPSPPIRERTLIGDDEHGWGDDGVFNFEGGCYAKTIRLSPIYEPDIYSTTRASAPSWRTWSSTRRRASWTSTPTSSPRTPAPPSRCTSSATASETGMAGHPSNVIFLTADAFGVLPPISRLDSRAGDVPLHQRLHRQAGRHRGGRQGAERPRSRPASAPRSCPATRACTPQMLGERLDRTTCRSGWSTPAGPAARTAPGERMNIDHTRHMVRAALNGAAGRRADSTRPDLRLRGADQLPGRPDRGAAAARHVGRQGRLRPPGGKLKQMFMENYKAYEAGAAEADTESG